MISANRDSRTSAVGSASLLVLLMLGTACPAEPEPVDDSGAASSGTEPTGETSASETDPTTATTTADTGTEGPADTETEGPAEVPWNEVPCDKNTCVGSDVCVQPGVGCNYAPCREGKEAQWINYPPLCQPLLDCDPADPVSCLQAEYCQLPESASFMDGQLRCAPAAKDCFCF